MPETIETTILCPVCRCDGIEITADRTVAAHRLAPSRRALCGASGVSIDPAGVKMGCDGCYRTLFVGERDTWPTVEDAVAAALDAGWTGDAHWSLCGECAAARKG
jgi:hypothetical protein